MRLISSFGLVSFGVVGTWWLYAAHGFCWYEQSSVASINLNTLVYSPFELVTLNLLCPFRLQVTIAL
jgi:hypothetical protein